MDLIRDPTAQEDPMTPSADGTPGYPKPDGTTIMTPQVFTHLLRELIGILEAFGGSALDPEDYQQIKTLIEAWKADGFFDDTLKVGGTPGSPKTLVEVVDLGPPGFPAYVGKITTSQIVATTLELLGGLTAPSVEADQVIAHDDLQADQGTNKPVIEMTGGDALPALTSVLLSQASTLAHEDDLLLPIVQGNYSGAGTPIAQLAYFSAGTVYVRLYNAHPSSAMDANCTVKVLIVKKGNP